MTDAELVRYSRHILLNEIGVEGQERIRQGRVLIIGAGGLGSPAALYLAAAGVGTLTLADGDTVDLTNLQRQILHREDRVGQAKAESGRQTLAALNPDVRLRPIVQRLQGDALDAEVAQADVVLDCCDNFATRHDVNRACVAAGVPLVSGAAVRFDGQLSVFDPRQEASPCYHCLFPEGEDVEEVRCAVMGVFAPLTGIIGTLQAAEALKLLAGCGEPLVGKLQLFDGLTSQWRTVRVPRDPDCPVCGQRDR
ncbi:molybdopterin-synthase adenylyltransferase MoeB [Oryzomicrobium sp.]|uniref:HesA/MoeB/ThiF family protein n=1 Tax=Oryzomicrobium sp. TaxID=1911578 RepID=UPI0025DAA342|nr:molybdopterin-synthase adenylyltransferase MoeB [Oryzomicrobium sp.]MCE1244706.1 molybdopterin-synthase adenylyltransferase MoeB [Oryzomicrobium sp.]